MGAGSTYFINANCYLRKQLLQTDRMAALFIEVLLDYRDRGEFLVHEFVAMRDHVHVLWTLTGTPTIERAAQLLKGGFSFRAGQQLGMKGKLWQPGYNDRRIRDRDHYLRAREYLLNNPVGKNYVTRREEWPWSSASGNYRLDELPQWLKPLSRQAGTPG